MNLPANGSFYCIYMLVIDHWLIEHDICVSDSYSYGVSDPLDIA